MKTLDIGCGDRPRGDVNLDRFYYGKWENFIIGEAHHLPFKDKAFDHIYSSNTLEHLENPLKFFKEAKRVANSIFECIYPTDSMIKKKTIHNLLNLRWSAAFKWKTKVTGGRKINYGGHRWQINNDKTLELLKKAGFTSVTFNKINFPTIRTNKDRRKWKWKVWLNKYLPRWQLETRFVAKV